VVCEDEHSFFSISFSSSEPAIFLFIFLNSLSSGLKFLLPGKALSP